MLRKVRSTFTDQPGLVTSILLVLFFVQFWLAQSAIPELSPGYLLETSSITDPANAAMQVALGTATVAAMVGGFAGVVVVFGLSSDDERFREVRQKAASSLRRNWRSVVSTPLLAAFGSLVAASLAAFNQTTSSLWVLEACVLLAGHGAFRLVVVLFELVKVVHAADEAALHPKPPTDPDTFLGN